MGGYKEYKIFDLIKRNSIITKYIVLISLVLIITISLLVQIFTLNKDINQFVYTENSSMDYKVYLKDNEFFEKNYVESENQYIASLINYIEANYNYELNVSKKDVDYKYKYKIVAEVNVRDKANQKTIYEYTDNLFVSEECKNNSSYDLKLKQNVKIDYNKYNDLIKKFVDLYDLEGSEAFVTVNMYVDFTQGIANESNKNNVPAITLVVPLTTDTMAIDMESNSTLNNEVSLATSTERNKYTFGMILFVLIDIILVIKLLVFINDTKNETSVYNMRLRRIMSNYGSYIQKITNEFIIGDRQILEIKSFEDLLQIKETVNLPILMKEREIIKETYFFIDADKTVYIYELSVGNLRNHN